MVKNTLNVGQISEGFVLDHIQAGRSMDIYKYLHLDQLDCCVAIIKNAKSNCMGKKDIMKIECPIDFMDLDILSKVPAVGFSIGFERVCGILLEQGYQIPGAKQKIALLYNSDVDFPAVLAKAAQLRDTYNVTVLPQAKKLGKQLGQLEASGFAGAAFMDKDEVKIFAQQ